MKYLMILLIVSCSHDQTHWEYESRSANWGELYKECKLGHNQSPIDLSLSESESFHQEIKFNYHDSITEVFDNGHTVKADIKEENSVTLHDKVFHLKQLHFHTHSEHSLDGVYYPVEMHLVHEADDKELLVLGFFIELTNTKTDRFGFFKNIPQDKSHGKSYIRLAKLSGYNGSHFYYKGSLTTPPCTEGVNWILFDKHINLRRDQVANFKSHYTSNYRQVQKMHQRKLYHSDI